MSITASRPNFWRKSSAVSVDKADRDRIVAVHVEDRRLDHLRDIGRVHGGARVFRQSGEADLVVDHDVHRPAGAVAVQLRHVERFRDDPLAGESRVAVDEQRQNFPPMLGVAANALPGARDPFHHRIDRLEMTRVGRKTNLHLCARRELSNRAITEVIFHVAVARDELGDVVGAEFGEDHLERFLEEIRQHIEPAAVRHAHANFLDPVARAAMQNRVEDDHERFRALERKALLPDIAGVEENLERFRLRAAAARSAISTWIEA